MKLLVGLGNPGEKYARNRHNVGFMAVERIAERHGFAAWRRKFQGLATEGEIGGEKVLLLKPDTYMNESGRAVGEAARFLKIAPADVVVLHDELDLAPGKLKVKTGGGNAGHNGLRSITAHIGNDYVRVRIGIGHPGAKELVHGWVLHDFARADGQWLEPLLDAIAGSASWLAAGDAARFLSDIALQVQPDDGTDDGKGGHGANKDGNRDGAKPRNPSKVDRPDGSDAAARSGGDRAHPAGERMGKRQTALAANLKKWMAGRNKPDG